VNISADRRELVSGFGPAPAVLGAPAFLSLQPGAPVDDDELIRRARRASAIAVALCGALGYLALRATATRAWSVLGAFTVLVAFSGCATLAQGLWQQTAALVPVMASVAALAWSERRPRWLTVGPALIGAAALIRPADFPLALGLFVAWVIMAQRARLSVGRLVGSCALAAAVASPWLLWNLVYVDSLLPLGQLRSNVGQAPGGAVFSVMPNRIVPALVGALVSPARGLVWYAPIVLLGVVLAARADGVGRSVAAGIAVELVVVAAFFKWWGGLCFGPRLLALSTWLGTWLAFRYGATSPPRVRRAVIGAATFTALIGALGLTLYDPRKWEIRRDPDHDPASLWDVRDSPLTALFRPVPARPLRDAPAGPFDYCTRAALATRTEPSTR
jgi:hypothetical protein